jgi:protocatechuate 4,5-dioxygenase beta chain
MTEGVAQPFGVDGEIAVLPAQIERINAALKRLRSELTDADPEILVIVGDDQDEVFGPALRPTLAVFTGTEVSGTASIRMLGEDLSENHVKMSCRSDLAEFLVGGLVAEGFDPAVIEELKPISRPTAGIGHAFAWSARALAVADLGIPVLPVFLNTYHPPLPSAARCYELGRTIARVFADRPERVAVLGSGGLSHDPHGPRAGWIDEPLDRWVLAQITNGTPQALTHLFQHESDAYHGGTGEIRAWIVAAAALQGARGTVLDYIPSRLATTGLAFAYWNPAQMADGRS